MCIYIGMTYLDSSRLQNTRLNGAEYDITLLNGFTPEQLHTLDQDPDIQSTGMETYAGFIKSTEFDPTVELGLLWCDETFWDDQMTPARTVLKGSYPQKKNEIMVKKGPFKIPGKRETFCGDPITLTYENNTGTYTEEFSYQRYMGWIWTCHRPICIKSFL